MDAASRIFKLLDSKRIEQKSFADALGTTDKIVSTWRTGRTKSYQKYLPQIAALLDTTVEYILTGVSPPEQKKEPAPVTGSELNDPLEAQLMNLVRQLTPDSKKMLIAQLKVLLSTQSPEGGSAP